MVVILVGLYHNLIFLVLHFYDYEQSNAPPSTIVDLLMQHEYEDVKSDQ